MDTTRIDDASEAPTICERGKREITGAQRFIKLSTIASGMDNTRELCKHVELNGESCASDHGIALRMSRMVRGLVIAHHVLLHEMTRE